MNDIKWFSAKVTSEEKGASAKNTKNEIPDLLDQGLLKKMKFAFVSRMRLVVLLFFVVMGSGVLITFGATTLNLSELPFFREIVVFSFFAMLFPFWISLIIMEIILGLLIFYSTRRIIRAIFNTKEFENVIKETRNEEIVKSIVILIFSLIFGYFIIIAILGLAIPTIYLQLYGIPQPRW